MQPALNPLEFSEQDWPIQVRLRMAAKTVMFRVRVN